MEPQRQRVQSQKSIGDMQTKPTVIIPPCEVWESLSRAQQQRVYQEVVWMCQGILAGEDHDEHGR